MYDVVDVWICKWQSPFKIKYYKYGQNGDLSKPLLFRQRKTYRVYEINKITNVMFVGAAPERSTDLH